MPNFFLHSYDDATFVITVYVEVDLEGGGDKGGVRGGIGVRVKWGWKGKVEGGLEG